MIPCLLIAIGGCSATTQSTSTAIPVPGLAGLPTVLAPPTVAASGAAAAQTGPTCPAAVSFSGCFSFAPASSAVPIGTTTPFDLYTHCGVDGSPIDFAGRLWQPVDPALRGQGAPDGFANPIDH